MNGMTKLYKHQQEILIADPQKCGIFHGTGSGKTRTALLLASGKILIIAPKMQKIDRNWEREAKALGFSSILKVISKEEFRRDFRKIPAFDTVIVDEAHTMAGVLPSMRYRNKKPIPKASQLFEALQHYLSDNAPKRLYLLTATPARSPMAVWAFAQLLGQLWDFYEFRNAFYVRLPWPGREIWTPRKDAESKKRLGKAIRLLGYTGKLSDWFDVPEQTHRTVSCELTKEQERYLENTPLLYPDPLVRLGKEHQIENGVFKRDDFSEVVVLKNNKIQKILSLLDEFPKVLIFAKYTAQIASLKRELEAEGIITYVMTGETKDRDRVLRNAEGSERCAFIAQAQLSSGWEVPSFRCTIFASASWSFVDLEQGRGRTLRANNLQKNLYVYLSAGKVDKAVWDALQHKQDFNEAMYLGRNKIST